ncbi:MAG: hypothetical protein LC111_07105 [Bacteroidia bacterium]|nr:hypothetical protein [Bacteroidia bacterium]
MKNKFIKSLVLVSSIIFTLSSCKKDVIDDNPAPLFTKASLNINVLANNNKVIWDSINYINASGNKYSLRTINFYISDIAMKRKDGFIHKLNKVFYIDPAKSESSQITIDSLLRGDYEQISFLVGLNPQKNIDYGLESTVDNLNMAWPTMMGGGYHFIKVEGHYLDSAGLRKGFAIHLGKNENLVNIEINKLMLQQKSENNYSLDFEINEIFANPYLYDLNIEKTYTMSDSLSMSKIKTNMQDAFTINQTN